MRITGYMTAHGVGSSRESAQIPLPSKNHAKSASLNKVAAQAASLGLRRIAGNIFINNSGQDFWKVNGDKLIRLTVQEVDLGESMNPAPADNPQGFITDIMSDLSF